MKRSKLTDMFDPEVLEVLRKQFDEADADGSGQIDSDEACALFARYCEPGSSEAQVKRTAEALKNQMDSDRNGNISFEEYAFRFGRKLQMEMARARRGGTMNHAAAPPPQREQPPSASAGGAGVHQRRAPTPASPPAAAGGASQAARGTSATSAGWSRETLTVVGIGLVMAVLLLFAVLTPGDEGGGGRRTRSRGR